MVNFRGLEYRLRKVFKEHGLELLPDDGMYVFRHILETDAERWTMLVRPIDSEDKQGVRSVLGERKEAAGRSLQDPTRSREKVAGS